tara:strand:+ start:881 stop:2404 length:1524 start_codon:yes stop_codon:yes gene_type:complete
MARNPLIPRTPGEQAVDRLLNQTLPQLIQNQQRKQEREENIARADRIREEDLARDQERYQARIEQDGKDRDKRTEEQAYTYYITAQQRYSQGEDSQGEALLEKSSKMYTELGVAAPFVLEDEKTFYQDKRTAMDGFESARQNFMLAKAGDVETELDNIVKFYEDNKKFLDSKTTLQPILNHVLENADSERYRDVFDSVDFRALNSEIKANQTYTAQMEFKSNNTLSDAWYNAETNGIQNSSLNRPPTTEELRKFYYAQNPELFKNVGRSYLDSTMSAYKTTDMSETYNNMSKFEQERILKNFNDAGSTAMFGDGRSYEQLDVAEKKQVDKFLQDTYNFPIIKYTDEDPNANEDNVDPNEAVKKRKKEYVSLSNKNFSEMTNDEKAKRNELAQEFGSSKEVTQEFKSAARLDKQIQTFENQIEAVKSDFDTYKELLNRIQEGELQPGRGGKYKAPNDLRKAGAASAAGIAFRGTEQQVKAQLERLQTKLDNLQGRLGQVQSAREGLDV